MPANISEDAIQKVSVIVPMYNAGPYIAEALESILTQTLPVSEIFVIDDGSTDNGCGIVGGYSNVVLLKKDHSGISDTLNQGLKYASGEYIAFLDADDRWIADKTEKQVRLLAEDDDLAMVFGHAERFQSIGEGNTYEEIIIDRMPGLVLQGGLFRHSAFQKVGLFSADPDVNPFMDWYARALAAGLEPVIHDQVVFQRRIHGNNYTLLNKNELLKGYFNALKMSIDRKRNQAL